MERDHGRFIQLDNNFVLETIDATVNTSKATQFCKLANHQASQMSPDKQTALLSAHLTVIIDTILKKFQALWHQSSTLQTELFHFRQWGLKYFTNTARSWLSKDRGNIVVPAGEAFISYQCAYTISCLVINHTCYSHIPVTNLHNLTLFLRLSDRALLPKSDVITCGNKPIPTFTLDTDQILWYGSSTGATTIIEKPEQHIQFPHLLKSPKGFDEKIIHHTSVKIDNFTIL